MTSAIPTRTLCVVVVLMLAVSGCLAFGASVKDDGSAPERMIGSLSRGLYGAAAASDGTAVFLFGGSGANSFGSTDIYRIDPRTLNVTDTGATMPVGRRLAPVVWTGDAFYLFGGNREGRKLQDILAFDPVKNVVTTKSAKLPQGLEGAAAVWTGKHVLVFGGCCLLTPPPVPVMPTLSRCYCEPSTAVYAYDPRTDSIVEQGAKLPGGRYYSSAVWDGTHAYVIGGENGKLHDEILKYNPAQDAFVGESARLPRTLGNTAAVWNGSHAFIVGGHDGKAVRPEILQFDPAGHRVEATATTLPSAREHAAAAFHDGALYVIGGNAAKPLNEIVKFDFGAGLKTTYSAAPAAT